MTDAAQPTSDPLGEGGIGATGSATSPSSHAQGRARFGGRTGRARRRGVAPNLGVRVAGSGHSFTPVVATSGLLLSLRRHAGARQRRSRAQARRAFAREPGSAISAARLKRSASRSPTRATSTPRRSPARCRLAPMAPGSGLAACRPRRSACGWCSPTDRSSKSTARPGCRNDGRRPGFRRHAWRHLDGHAADDRRLQSASEKLWRDDFEACMESHDELGARTIAISASSGARSPESRHLYCLPDVASVSQIKRESRRLRDEGDGRHRRAAPSRTRRLSSASPISSEIYPIEYVPNFHELEYAVPVENGKEALRRVRELMLTKHTNCIYPSNIVSSAGD